MAWEKAYIEYLKNYSSLNFTLAFTSERSIQDEIDRESMGDVYTIVISYLVMFVYVTLALGDYNRCDSNKSYHLMADSLFAIDENHNWIVSEDSMIRVYLTAWLPSHTYAPLYRFWGAHDGFLSFSSGGYLESR